MRTFTTADLNKKVGDITDAARRKPVLLTHHRQPRFALMLVEAYESLTQSKATGRRTGFTLETMPGDVADGLLASPICMSARWTQAEHRNGRTPATSIKQNTVTM
ncbi:type II toxin-antitoxin system prevent-host-death family antitoxin [Microvirga tunisiensis]|uniref:type II toxin-antitoxin system prevent-host-death family antitoxin n=1 Tax=Microvirga tunisiensis TaxID=2108360 RepID=UPI0018657757|nr:type II toxin-antitoxin system prevent-host-death family antitoxin [Microvirga tunisiensis]